MQKGSDDVFWWSKLSNKKSICWPGEEESTAAGGDYDADTD